MTDSLERGLRVIVSFLDAARGQTLTEIAERTGLSRSTVRRIVLTLNELGYLRREQQRIFPTSRLLDLGPTGMIRTRLIEAARPAMTRVVTDLDQTIGLSVLDRGDIVYIGEVQTKRLVRATIEVGARLPAHATSMGRVLLAGLPDNELGEFFDHAKLRAFTEHTTTDLRELFATIREVGRLGYSIVDQELEAGVRSVAAPIRGGSGETVAAIDLTFFASEVTLSRVHNEFLPRLVTAADEIGLYLPTVATL